MGDGLKFTIEAENQSAQAVGQAILQIRQYDEELKKLKASGDATAATAQRLGELHVQHATAIQNLRQKTNELTQSQTQLRSVLDGVRSELSRQAGPLGGIVQLFTGFSLGAGLVAAGAAAVGVALVASAKAAGEYVERMEQIQFSTGLSQEALAGFKLAASDSGRSLEDIKPSIDFFVRKIGEAKDKSSEAASSFRNLGVSVRDSSGNIRSVEDVLRDTQNELNKIKDVTERSQKAFELFGRGSARALDVLLSPLDALKLKAKEAGLVLSEEMVANAKKADTAFDHLKVTWEAFVIRQQTGTAQVGTAWANLVTGVLKEMDRWEEKWQKDWKQFMSIRNPLEQTDFARSLGLDVPRKFGIGSGGASSTAGAVGTDADVKAEKERAAFEATLATIQKRVALQPTLKDAALDQLASMQKQADTQREINRLLEVAAKIQGIQTPLIQGPASLFWARAGETFGPLSTGNMVGDVGGRRVSRDWADAVGIDATRMKPDLSIEGLDAVSLAIDKVTDHAKDLAKTLDSSISSTLSGAIKGFNDLGDVISSVINAVIDNVVQRAVEASGITAIITSAVGAVLPFIGLAPALPGTGVTGGPSSPRRAASGPNMTVFAEINVGSFIGDEKRLSDAVTDHLARKIQEKLTNGGFRNG